MSLPGKYLLILSTACAAASTLWLARAGQQDQQLTIEHAECSYFGPDRERFRPDEVARGGSSRRFRALSSTTAQVASMMPGVPGGSRTYTYDRKYPADSIDSFIFADFQKHGITPAPATNDWEFIRRVTLDLTGRIPAPEHAVAFAADATPGKRARLIDELMARPEWVDKWTMYFGDLYQNSATRPSTGLNRFPQGRNAFYAWIRESLANNKPYNRMAAELIGADGANSYNDGQNNFLLNGFITGGPNHDVADAMTATVFQTFLGLGHVNCLLCHNGRGHTDSLSVWATGVTRYQAWQLASHFSRTNLAQVRPDPAVNNVYYWAIQDNVRFRQDYTLNTTTGNRPARVAPAGCRSGQPCFYVAPQYIFNGDSPQAGENYRVALARNVTNDFQFARATVNYLWAYFFGRGLVDPPDAFDLARLDPNDPPPAPWTLQPSNPALLNALAQHFVAGGYDLKALMREIAGSDTYQLSSRYPGEWKAEYEPYFARKYVRRLWGEEIHDAVALSSGALPSYTYRGFTDQGYPPVQFAMQLPDVVNAPGDGTATAFLDGFLRGNRDDQPRKYEGSILQALQLMNSPFVTNRVKATGAAANQVIARNLTRSNNELVNLLFLSILSRFPSESELDRALAAVPATGDARTTALQDLAWSLYNKVDFFFNY